MDVQPDVLQPNHVTLCRLHGKSRMDEQHGVFLGHGVVPSREGGESALHRAGGRNAAERVNIHTDKGSHELRCSLFDAWNATVGRVDGGTTFGECLLLSFQRNLRRLQPRHTHFEVDDLLSRLLFQHT